jgi:hypothetical protein
MPAMNVSGMLARFGRPVTIRRGETEYTVQASVKTTSASELNGRVKEVDRELRIAAADLVSVGFPFPPVAGDQVVVDGRTTAINSVAVNYLRGEPALVVLTTRGL